MPEIVPERVKQIRENQGKTQTKLLKAAKGIGIAKRTLQRIEGSPKETYSVQDRILTELATALRVDPKVLTGELPIPEELLSRNQPDADREQIASTCDVESFETRLVKTDSDYVIVEFSKSNPTGRIIARGISDEAAGLRLASCNSTRELLSWASEALTMHEAIEDVYLEEEVYAKIEAIYSELRNPAFQTGQQQSAPVRSAERTEDPLKSTKEIDSDTGQDIPKNQDLTEMETEQ